tara:strand:+ start:200 stop:355 length:156 start_codon:yes stop_codon:yes gene_type:complete
MASKVYVVMNDLGINAVFGKKSKADERALFIQDRYTMKHWVETWEIEKDAV